MNKLWLIIQREYLTRVKTKAFIITTLLTPIGIAAFIAVATLILSYEGDGQRIAVKDESGILAEKGIKDSERAKFFLKNEPLETLLKTYKENDYNGVLHIPASVKNPGDKVNLTFHSDEQISATTKMFIESRMASRIRTHKIALAGYDEERIKSFNTDVNIKEKGTSGKAEDKGNRAVMATIFGGIIGYAMLIVIMIYGQMVMRSVMEEKTTRIVEVMISSVKPFQLMMGKLIGVGGVGLTQLLVWAILIPGLLFLVGLFIPMDGGSMQDMNTAGADIDPEEMESMVYQFMDTLSTMNWWLIVPVLILFFLGGYFMYAAMYAAIGSAIGDDLGEGQSIAVPIALVLTLAFYVAFSVIQNPNSSMAVWSSMVPFFSPIVMPTRLAFDPPLWQILASLAILIASAVFLVWLAARIYRVGILMYGKKATFMEIGKWLFYRG